MHPRFLNFVKKVPVDLFSPSNKYSWKKITVLFTSGFLLARCGKKQAWFVSSTNNDFEWLQKKPLENSPESFTSSWVRMSEKHLRTFSNNPKTDFYARSTSESQEKPTLKRSNYVYHFFVASLLLPFYNLCFIYQPVYKKYLTSSWIRAETAILYGSCKNWYSSRMNGSSYLCL